MTAPPGDRDQIFADWDEWVGVLWNEVVRLHWHRAVWCEVRDEIQARTPHADQTFLASYTATYVTTALMTIRRLIDTDENTRSLVSLIAAIKRNPEVVTRTRYSEIRVERNPESAQWIPGKPEFERAWSSSLDPEHIDPAILDGDVASLAAELTHADAWATKTIAHLDPRRPEVPMRFDDLDHAIDYVTAVYDKYQLLIRQSSTTEYTPAIQGDWHEPLRAPLFWAGPDVWGWPHPYGYI